MPAPQNLRNHSRVDPAIHFFVVPVLLINVVVAIWQAVVHWNNLRAFCLWWIVVAIALVIVAAKTRMNALKVQDRIIRLEEHLRLATLLPAEQKVHIPELTTPQLIALRFASDEELPALVHKTLTRNLEPKQIKESITHWRADHERV
ncbi:MAG TPA: DUF6526 family protein [Edaphobacter sp.]